MREKVFSASCQPGLLQNDNHVVNGNDSLSFVTGMRIELDDQDVDHVILDR